MEWSVFSLRECAEVTLCCLVGICLVSQEEYLVRFTPILSCAPHSAPDSLLACSFFSSKSVSIIAATNLFLLLLCVTTSYTRHPSPTKHTTRRMVTATAAAAPAITSTLFKGSRCSITLWEGLHSWRKLSEICK